MDQVKLVTHPNRLLLGGLVAVFRQRASMVPIFSYTGSGFNFFS